jgi:predicted CXXCH cytochrome family protein
MALGGALLLLATGVVGDSAVTEGSKAAGLETCVAPTAEIRRNHMDYLKHDRDATVHQGIRDTRFSLAECVQCHAEKDSAGAYKPVNAEGQFCESCHSYVAVNLTCFQCHSKTPEDANGNTSAGVGGGAGELRALGRLPAVNLPLSLSRDELARLHATTHTTIGGN